MGAPTHTPTIFFVFWVHPSVVEGLLVSNIFLGWYKNAWKPQKSLLHLLLEYSVTLDFFFPSTLLEHLQQCWVSDPEKIYFTSNITYVIFCSPIHITETLTANRWGTSNRNHLDESLWWTNQKQHWAAIRSYLSHSFLHVHTAAVPFTSHGNVRNYAEPKPFSWARSACVGFSSSNFTVYDHILSTGGDAVRTWEFDTWSSSQHPGTSTCTYGGQSKPTATSTSSIGCLLWLMCGWTPSEWTLHFPLRTTYPPVKKGSCRLVLGTIPKK